MERDEYFARWADLHGGYDPRTGGRVVRWWLTMVHAFARPFVALRIPPDGITVLGALLSGVVVWLAALGDRWLLLAVVVVALSGVVDNLDGAVAVMTDRTTAFGYVLDSVADRISDTLYVVALFAVGAPGWLCVTGGVLMFLQEYMRARAASGGMTEIGIVTVWERPTRVIVTAMFLLGAGIYVSAAQEWATAGAAAWTTLGTVGCLQLLVTIHRRLT